MDPMNVAIYSCCLRLHEGCNDPCVLRVLEFMDVHYVLGIILLGKKNCLNTSYHQHIER